MTDECDFFLSLWIKVGNTIGIDWNAGAFPFLNTSVVPTEIGKKIKSSVNHLCPECTERTHSSCQIILLAFYLQITGLQIPFRKISGRKFLITVLKKDTLSSSLARLESVRIPHGIFRLVVSPLKMIPALGNRCNAGGVLFGSNDPTARGLKCNSCIRKYAAGGAW